MEFILNIKYDGATTQKPRGRIRLCMFKCQFGEAQPYMGVFVDNELDGFSDCREELDLHVFQMRKKKTHHLVLGKFEVAIKTDDELVFGGETNSGIDVLVAWQVSEVEKLVIDAIRARVDVEELSDVREEFNFVRHLFSLFLYIAWLHEGSVSKRRCMSLPGLVNVRVLFPWVLLCNLSHGQKSGV
jgi:hypothetical protein